VPHLLDPCLDVRAKLGEVAKKLVTAGGFIDGVHVFTGHGDVPDDSALRLVVMPPETWYSKAEPRVSQEAVMAFVKNNGTKPRYRGNRLLFLAADQGILGRLRDAVKVALAWGSIVKDVNDGKLNIDQIQKKQAEVERETADKVLPKVLRECYKWLLCPVQHTAGAPPEVEAYALSTSAASTTSEVERVCDENELVIKAWSPVHLRATLAELYWRDGVVTARAMRFWEDTLRYLYLPRLRNKDVLAAAIKAGAARRDFFGTAHGESDGRFDGFGLGDGDVQLTDTLLLIEPAAAVAYEAKLAQASAEASVRAMEDAQAQKGEASVQTDLPMGGSVRGSAVLGGSAATGTPGTQLAKLRSYHGTAEVTASMAKMRLTQLAEEIINVLVSDPNAVVKVTLEIQAEFPNGAPEHVKRAVSENAKSLGLKVSDWE
jgi:hypothetical protein